MIGLDSTCGVEMKRRRVRSNCPTRHGGSSFRECRTEWNETRNQDCRCLSLDPASGGLGALGGGGPEPAWRQPPLLSAGGEVNQRLSTDTRGHQVCRQRPFHLTSHKTIPFGRIHRVVWISPLVS